MFLCLIIYEILRSILPNIGNVEWQGREKRMHLNLSVDFFSNEVSLIFLLAFDIFLGFQLSSHFKLISGCKI